jgi:LuxR family maltose regulon positive regulatory protein
MAIPPLKTKLHIAPIRTDVVPRPRLVERLNAGLGRKLTLISAPAGYGKTTLLAQFTADAPIPVVWYQLDASDNDPADLFDYLIVCIAGRFVGFGTAARSVLQASENIAAEWQSFLVVLINEIVETVAGDSLVILQDHHVIDNPLIHAFIDGLLAQAPTRFHLLLSTPSDPLISLAHRHRRRPLPQSCSSRRRHAGH